MPYSNQGNHFRLHDDLPRWSNGDQITDMIGVLHTKVNLNTLSNSNNINKSKACIDCQRISSIPWKKMAPLHSGHRGLKILTVKNLSFLGAIRCISSIMKFWNIVQHQSKSELKSKTAEWHGLNLFKVSLKEQKIERLICNLWLFWILIS